MTHGLWSGPCTACPWIQLMHTQGESMAYMHECKKNPEKPQYCFVFCFFPRMLRGRHRWGIKVWNVEFLASSNITQMTDKLLDGWWMCGRGGGVCGFMFPVKRRTEWRQKHQIAGFLTEHVKRQCTQKLSVGFLGIKHDYKCGKTWPFSPHKCNSVSCAVSPIWYTHLFS